ncbi:hypothetical protein Glove_217g50 [Diversispora epigaea]|uniref:Uncharacterized protein n=1 Tax=Diversispora epigaea TaxID=1348612 RepID=A0A397IGU7_9GLOM|nr:hypothetical protein Glove_217g50 [Diversispora epigaea]
MHINITLSKNQDILKFKVSKTELVGKTNEKIRETWMDNLIIEDILKKENIPFYRFSEFQNNSENILVHFSDSLSFLANGHGPIQYMDFQYLEIFSTIGKNKSSDIFGLRIIWEISSDCWKHDENSPDIFQVVKDLSEIIIFDGSVELEPPQLQSYNFTDVKLKNKIKLDFLLLVPRLKEHKKNPVEILHEMIRHPSYYWFTSLIGFFYQFGIGTVVDNQMAFKFFNLAANEIIDPFSSNSSSLRKLYDLSKEISPP